MLPFFPPRQISSHFKVGINTAFHIGINQEQLNPNSCIFRKRKGASFFPLIYITECDVMTNCHQHVLFASDIFPDGNLAGNKCFLIIFLLSGWRCGYFFEFIFIPGTVLGTGNRRIDNYSYSWKNFYGPCPRTKKSRVCQVSSLDEQIS